MNYSVKNAVKLFETKRKNDIVRRFFIDELVLRYESNADTGTNTKDNNEDGTDEDIEDEAENV